MNILKIKGWYLVMIAGVIIRMFIMSVSLSIDAFGIGLSYQLKGIRLGVVSRILIGMVSTVVMGFSMLAGQKMLEYFPPYISEKVGTAILVVVGLIFIRNAIFGGEESICDLDRSKDINPMEALLLGCALSADCLSIGIAAAGFHMESLLLPFCVGAMQCLFLWLGKYVSEKQYFKKEISGKKSSIVAGGILIFIGIFRNF